MLVNVKESNQLGSLPRPIRDAISGAGSYYPKVVVTDPAMSKVYAAYPYNDLKEERFRTLVRDARRAFDEDVDRGALPEPGSALESEEVTTVEDKTGEKTFQPTDFAFWKSVAGNQIEARIVEVDAQGRYVFESRDGRKIPVAPNQLDSESRDRAAKATEGTM